ncbi:MAG: 3-methylfumaryl-CoA hydratase [Paracoccaceae bacterium]|jgi:3-methylfumaryl-CoA hydratase
MDIDYLRTWIGRQENAAELVSQRLVHQFNATFDLKGGSENGSDAPLMIHFCLAQPVAPTQKLGDDGHPERGGFLPPIPLSRRMWAGGAVNFHSPLRVGDLANRRSTIKDVVLKQGSSGTLYFVTVEHEITCDSRKVLTERQDIVYRAVQTPQKKLKENLTLPQKGPDEIYSRIMVPTPTLLFRYSALTFNGHRIHYDFPYSTKVEGYSGLVVHGPLQASVLCHLASELKGAHPTNFRFRSLVPIFDTSPFTVNAKPDGDGMRLWTAVANGPISMEAYAVW